MPELYGMPERYSRISPAARAAADVDHIVRAIDWDPTCLPGDERRAIVRQVLDLATPLPAVREISSEAVDWPVRFRAAAEVTEHMGHRIPAGSLRVLSKLPGSQVEAIGRALLGEYQ